MKMTICSVFDSAAATYGRPFFVPSRQVGIRTFTDEVNREDEQSNLYLHPDDFSLFVIGEFDDQSGVFDTHAPEVLIRAKDVKIV